MPTSVRWLDEIADDDVALVGGKALNLSRLRRAGLEVPRGFVIRTDDLEAGSIPPEIRAAVLDFYHRSEAPAVAVRSSATVEDSATASFAGQGRSVLNVRTDDDLLEAVSVVCRSMATSGARGYARRMGLRQETLIVHVVVQEMVEADVSGVLFTSNPVSVSDDEIVINAIYGLGEPLVSGKVTPDEIIVQKSTGQLKSYVIGSKELTLTSSGLLSTPAEKSDRPCLNDEQINQLADAGRRIEGLFGAAQDIEWAWRDKLYILQARPLTIRPCTDRPRATSQPGDADSSWQNELERLQSISGVRHKVWIAKGIAEMLPCPTPLSWEVASRFMSGEEGYGLAQQRLGYAPAPGSILERIAGRIYVDLDRESGLFFQYAPISYAMEEIRKNPLRASMPRQSFDWRKLRPNLLMCWPILIFQFIRLMKRLRQLRRDFFPYLERSFLPAFMDYVRATRQTDYHSFPNGQLVEQFRRRLNHFLCHSTPVMMTGSILSAMSYRELEDLLIERLGRDGIELAQQLMSGLRPNPTLDMHQAMYRLARGKGSEKRFLSQFGHRCGDEFELAAPRWREDRKSLLEQIDQLADSDPIDDAHHRKGEAVRLDAEARLGQLETQWGRVGREMIRSRLMVARRLFPLREQAKNYLMMEYELLRAPLVALDRRLRLDGGIFYLSYSELHSFVSLKDKATEGQTTRELIVERQRQHRLQQQLQLPHVILGHQLFEEHDKLLRSYEKQKEYASGGLRGIGVSPGIARGRARILNSIADLSTVHKGEILVVPSLDPTWTPAFAQAAGLVAGRGAILSHGAILAREFALPAIVSMEEVTSRLRDGQEVEIDGTTGKITTLDASTC